jgi:hypothetical protein
MKAERLGTMIKVEGREVRGTGASRAGTAKALMPQLLYEVRLSVRLGQGIRRALRLVDGNAAPIDDFQGDENVPGRHCCRRIREEPGMKDWVYCNDSQGNSLSRGFLLWSKESRSFPTRIYERRQAPI